MTLFVASILGSTATLVPGAAAHAAFDPCLVGEVCVWENAGFTGGFAAWTSSITNLSGKTFDNGHPMNDKISSLKNRTSHWVYFYPDSYYRGGYDLAQSPGGYRTDLAIDSRNSGLRYNDVFSSALIGS